MDFPINSGLKPQNMDWNHPIMACRQVDTQHAQQHSSEQKRGVAGNFEVWWVYKLNLYIWVMY